MSRTDPKCYPPEEGELGWHDDRDWLDKIFDDWRDGAKSLSGIHRVIYLCGSPFPDAYDFKSANRSRDMYRFPMPSIWFKPSRAARKAHLTAQFEQLINRCKGMPKC